MLPTTKPIEAHIASSQLNDFKTFLPELNAFILSGYSLFMWVLHKTVLVGCAGEMICGTICFLIYIAWCIRNILNWNAQNGINLGLIPSEANDSSKYICQIWHVLNAYQLSSRLTANEIYKLRYKTLHITLLTCNNLQCLTARIYNAFSFEGRMNMPFLFDNCALNIHSYIKFGWNRKYMAIIWMSWTLTQIGKWIKLKKERVARYIEHQNY